MSFPISVSTDAGESQELILGLDPEATAEIDTALGEGERPPPPPSGIFDARLIDADISAGPFGEGLTVDIREGDGQFIGTKRHEVQYQPGGSADTVSVTWDLPEGVAGTLTDVVTGGDLVDAQMEGEGQATITNLNVTELFVALDYALGNRAPTVLAPLPDDTIEVRGPPLRLSGLGTVFRDPDGDSLSIRARSSAPSVLSVPGQGRGRQIPLNPKSVGSAEVTLTAGDGAAEASTSFSVRVAPDDGKENPSGQAVAAVDTAGSGPAIDFGETGVRVAFSEVRSPGSASVERFDSPPVDTSGIAESNVSDYRLVIEGGGGLRFGDSTEVRLAVGAFDGIATPDSVRIYRRPVPGGGTFDSLETRVDEASTPQTGDDTLEAQVESFSEFVLASDADPLPVELSNFRAQATESSAALLTWKSASETKSAGFAVQHRPPGSESWTKLGFVESKASGGTTTEAKTYRFTAEDLSVGTHRFRLKQVDLDGSKVLTDPVTVRLRMKEALRLAAPSPNPVTGTATFSFAVKEESKAGVVLYDVLGQQVQTLYEGTPAAGESQTVRLNARDLPSGIYFLRLQAGEKTRTTRFTVLR